MREEESAGNPAALVVPGDPEDVDSRVGEIGEPREDALGEPRGDAAPVEEVAAVDEDVRFAPRRGLERPLEALEEVVAAPRALHARPRRKVEAEVRVGEEEDAQRHGAEATRLFRFRRRTSCLAVVTGVR